MSAGKTEFRLALNIPKEEANRIIQQYLMANGFEQQQRENVFFYYSRKNGSLRAFEYYLNDYELLVFAYFGTFEAPQKLEGMLEGFQKQDYRNEIMALFGEINRIEQYQQVSNMQTAGAWASGVQTTYGNHIGNNGYVNTNSTNPNIFIEENERKKERYTILGFVVAMIVLLLSCLDVKCGAVIICLELWCAMQGLKTRKKGFAIATILMAVLSIGFLILYEISTAMLSY